MSRSTALGDVEADLTALRAAAERAGTALASLFATSGQFEAAVIITGPRERARGVRSGRRRISWSAIGTLALALVFLML